MVNLTAEASLLVGPVVFGTLVKHYFERFKKDKYHSTQLRRDELLYDEIFNLAKVRGIIYACPGAGSR